MFNWKQFLLEHGWTQDGDYYTFPHPHAVAEDTVIVITGYLFMLWRAWTYNVNTEATTDHILLTKTTFIEYVEALSEIPQEENQ